jgi:flavorubredoxin
MNTLIIVESYFGNTSLIVKAIADGIAAAAADNQVQIIAACDASAQIPDDTPLLIVAAPTHNFGLPSPATRAQAEAKGAANGSARGVREWIETAEFRPSAHVITIDTSVKSRFSPSTAAKTARKLMKRRNVSSVERGPSFFVNGTTGPLLDGETDRARAWGIQIARAATIV